MYDDESSLLLLFFTGGDFSDISDQLAPIPRLFEFRRSAAGWIDDDDDGELSVSDIAGYVELIGKPLRGRGVEGIREKFKLVYGATGGDYRLLRDKLIGWIVKLIGEKLRERIKGTKYFIYPLDDSIILLYLLSIILNVYNRIK